MKAEVVKGTGEGAKYVEVYADKMKKLIGLVPYHGTLNLKVESLPPFDEPHRIEAFGNFGVVEMVPCAVNYERAWAVFPEKGEQKEGVVEIIAEKNLKEVFGLKEGSFVDLQF